MPDVFFLVAVMGVDRMLNLSNCLSAVGDFPSRNMRKYGISVNWGVSPETNGACKKNENPNQKLQRSPSDLFSITKGKPINSALGNIRLLCVASMALEDLPRK